MAGVAVLEAGTEPTWCDEPNLHGATWAFEAILSLCHLGALLVVLDHLAVYGRFLRAKIRVSELEVKYTVPEVKGGDGFAVIHSNAILQDNHGYKLPSCWAGS